MEAVLFILQAIALILFSALCSGLNISLLSLDLSDLRRKARSGSPEAKQVLPLRKNVHLSLAAILLGNVGMSAATALVLGSKLSGLAAGTISTLLLVTFAEIMPQAIFARNALTLTSRFSGFLKLLIIVTFPVSKPLQLLLDRLFGRHTTKLHTRQELGIIIGEHADSQKSELDEDEVEIIRSALKLSEKRVQQIFTPINKVYWLTPDSAIDADKIDEIKEENYSRIPIFNNKLTECYGMLLMKNLVDIDFDERSYQIDELPTIPIPTVGSQTALDTMFRKFIGAHTHLMAVEKNGKIIGIITIEDLIEEILGHEIEDESDTHR